jgi:4-amino-4-deoxy-L-arabinose transferase-like glycosyltransferase
MSADPHLHLEAPHPPAPAAAAASPAPAQRLALLGVLGLAAALRLWHLDQNGYGRTYYAAGVRSMLGSLHNFLYNSFDPAGFVSLDKPPVSMWLQVLCAKILGFSAFSVMLPQVLEGIAAVGIVHHLVARRFGRTAALVAALCLALTPITVAADRSNNTESCLILVLLLAAWAAIRAAETASARLLVVAMVLAGVGFNVKMAAALVVVPSFLLAYWLGAAGLPIKRRLPIVGLSAVVLALVSLSWVTAFDLTPPDDRPYAGSTVRNSMLELAVLHNGLDRFVQPAPGKARAPRNDAERAAMPAGSRGEPQSVPPAALWDQTPIGPLRLATPRLAAQFAWLLPLMLAGVAFWAMPSRGRRRWSAEQLNVLVWAGWAFTYAAVFSFAGGVFHTYYLAVLAPAAAALAGVGWAALWTRYRQGSLHLGLPAALLATAAWQFYIEKGGAPWHDDWRGWLLVASTGALVLTAMALLAIRPHRGKRWPAPLAALGLLAMLAMPAAWALSTVLVRPNVATPSANIDAFTSMPGAPDDATGAAARASTAKLIQFLEAQRGTEQFLLAVPNALQAAPIIVRTGEPVMAMGGYLGRDPILTTRELERMVSDGELRFVMLGGPSIVPPTSARERVLAEWIRAHGTPVDPALWRAAQPLSEGPADLSPARADPPRLYDLGQGG